MAHEVQIRIKNNFSELETVRSQSASFYTRHQIPLKDSNAVELAISEVITNIISYGYQDDSEYYIDVHLLYENDQLILRIEDDARAFNPLTISDPDTAENLDDRPIGGLGIHLVRQMMDDVSYSYQNNRNCLTMVKKLKET